MCLYINAEKHKKDSWYNYVPKVLDKDLIVYKTFVVAVNEELVSPYQGFNYGNGGEFRTTLKLVDIDHHVVADGFHSFLRKRKAQDCAHDHTDNWGECTEVKRCTIPAGSEVFYGVLGDIVSNAIVI